VDGMRDTASGLESRPTSRGQSRARGLESRVGGNSDVHHDDPKREEARRRHEEGSGRKRRDAGGPGGRQRPGREGWPGGAAKGRSAVDVSRRVDGGGR